MKSASSNGVRIDRRYPSALFEVAHYMLDAGRSLKSVKGIVTTSETLIESQKKRSGWLSELRFSISMGSEACLFGSTCEHGSCI